MKILHVIPHARAGAAIHELELLLSSPENEHHICCLGPKSGVRSRVSGVKGNQADFDSGHPTLDTRPCPLEMLNWKRWLDPRPLWNLAGSIRTFQPNVIHVWGLPSLCAVFLAARKTDAIIAVREPIPSERSVSSLERWLLRRADRVLARSNAEARRCTAAGVSPHKLHLVPPGVRAIPRAQDSSKPLILCLGELLHHKGFYDAIWAFDILNHVHSNVELAIVGEGPDRPRLVRLALAMGNPRHIHLPGATADVDSWLARASLVWIPSLTDSGIATALTAMAAGKAVFAYRQPSLSEFILHGESGILVEPGNKMDLASQTSQLLLSPANLCRLGDAGRKRARESYSPEAFLNSWTRAVADPDSAAAVSSRTAPFPGKYANVGRA